MIGSYKVKRRPGRNVHYYCNNCNKSNLMDRTTCTQCGHTMADRLKRPRK